MAKSNREKQIIIAAGASLVALVLNFAVYKPYVASLEKLAQEKELAEAELAKADTILRKQSKLRRALTNLRARGLKDDASQAESQVFEAVRDAADTSRVLLTSFKSDKVTAGGNFQELDYSVTGTGATAQLSRMLWAFETAPAPLRVKEMVITSRKDATDDLQVTMKIATLASNPDAMQPANDAAPGGGVQ